MTSRSPAPRPAGPWRRAAASAGLLDEATGTLRPTIFAEMTALAARSGAINLGQGFPDVDGPQAVLEAAIGAMRSGANQYAPGDGVPALRTAVAAHQADRYGLDVDPDSQVLVTTGATEAIAATVLALTGPGDEVLTLEPSYDSYAAVIGLAGASHTTAPLLPGPHGFRLDEDALRTAFSARTRVVLVNTPHNPTGAVLPRADLELLARLAREHDAIVVTDEVYEHLTFDGALHVPVASLPRMAERTVTISSAGKTFSFTGWKVGWLHGPPGVVDAIRAVKQYLTYTSGAPFQHAIAFALADDGVQAWVADLAADLAVRRDLLCEGLEDAGFEVVRPRGTYFVVADASGHLERLGLPDGASLCRALPELAGVVGVPVGAFTKPGSAADDALGAHVRFTFVKRPEVLEEAVARLGALRPSARVSRRARCPDAGA